MNASSSQASRLRWWPEPAVALTQVSAGAAPAVGPEDCTGSGFDRPAAPSAADAADASAIGLEVQSAFEYLPATLIGMLAGAGIVLLLFWTTAPSTLTGGWLAAFGLLWASRAALLQGYRRAVRRGEPDWLGWRRLWSVGTLASAALWGAAAWIFYGFGTGIQQTGLIIVIYTYCIAAVPVLANQSRLFASFAALCFLPLVARIVLQGDLYSYQLAAELLLIVGLTALLLRSYRLALQRVTELKLQADDLLAALRVEKRSAEGARHEAEVANRAKTQFFAAASHDLRQPLHAMGLFAEALRQRRHEPEVARLVNSINESVDALEGLFSELLDITRIDSGGVEVQPRHFALADMCRRLLLHFEPAAFEKGLELRLRDCGHVLYGDPLLTERVLRNLVSNAIRYTERGGVLLGCRHRGGRISLQVWDTGIGIRDSDRSRVFEEFFQVPTDRPASADQRKGLGLGLAIVRRLADLMDAPLALASRPDRGTVFSIELPLGNAALIDRSPPPARAVPELTLRGHLVIVIEDDAAVRAGLEVLLSGWGATHVTFAGVPDLQRWLAAAGSSSAAPALVIADYRLESAQTGIDAITALRARFGAALPAILVTGSTMAGHEHDARLHDFHVLTKPVLPNKLRAMIAFKLASGSARAGSPAGRQRSGEVHASQDRPRA